MVHSDQKIPIGPGEHMVRRKTGMAGLALAALVFATSSLAAIGRTPGSAGASPSGTAQFSFPLALPPGTRGLTPQLGLSYSSAGGRGIVGVGWAISGVSVIARCERTVAQDGLARPVQNDSGDAFCLNGNKLRVVSGVYGAAGSTYRTEIETYSKITANGTAGNGPQSFQVYGRDGLIYDYGTAESSRIQSVGQTTVRAWALNRVSDRQGNFIDFVWGEDTVNGGFRLEEVQYTGSAAVTAPYKVDFKYGNRIDVDIEYIAGSPVQELSRLTSIDVTYQSALIHRYVLTYDVSATTGRDRFVSLQECAGAVPDCMAPTTLTYQSGSIGLQGEQATGITPAGSLFVVDVNGDARDDLVYSSTATSGTGVWMVAFANAGGGYNTPVNTGVANTNFSGAIPIDYNADGRADLLVPYSGTTWWVMLGSASGLAAPVNTGTPKTTTGTGANARGLDINGDGRQDLVWADLVGYGGGDAIRYRANLASGGFSSTVQTIVGPLAMDQKIMGLSFGSFARPPDFDGDGRADVLYRWVERFSTTLAPQPLSTKGTLAADGGSTDLVGAVPTDGQAVTPMAGGYTYIYFTTAYCPGSAGTFQTSGSQVAGAAPYFGDFNGDGKSDLLYYDDSLSWKYRYSTGLGFTSPQTGPSYSTYMSWSVQDWDGDGNDDAIGIPAGGTAWYLMRSSGVAFAAPVTTGIAATGVASAGSPIDVDGDGLRDLTYRNSAGALLYRRHTLDTALPDLLSSVQDAYGTQSTFTYLPLSNAAVYTKGTGAVYPLVDVQTGRWVVSQIARTDGSGNSTTAALNFTYEAARSDLQGRGFAGFAKRTTVDTALGLNRRTIETYQQSFPYIGAPATVELQQSSGTRIGYTSHTWSNLSYGTGYGTYWYPYIASTTTDQHEVGGIYNGTKVRSVSTVVAAVDGIDTQSGLVKDVTTTTTEVATGLFPGAYKTERTQHTSVVYDAANWCIGRPSATSQTSSHTLNGGASVTRTSDMTWDSVNCRPTQARLEPGNASLQVTVGYGYDSFGNVGTETVTGVGMAARTTTTGWGSTGQFPLTVTNALNQTTTTVWNGSVGQPASTTDANGLAVSWSYDVFGRRTLETRPDQTSTTWAYTSCTGSCDSRTKLQVTQQERDTASSTIRTQTDYLDRWDRPFWKETQLLTTNDVSVTVRQEFDARGRLSKDFVPYLRGGYDNGYRMVGYDGIDRPTSQSMYRAGGVLDRTTSLAYNGLASSATDPLSHTTTRIASAWGDLQRVTDASSGQTNYQFDAFGLLKQATDAANNVVTQVNYNVRGMRYQLIDMDLGTWSYTPNALGEVVSQTDAKSQTTSFSYDALGRPATRTEAEGTSTWTWGSSAVAYNIGRLQSVSGPGYAESFTYDSTGRPQTRTITSDASYQFDYAYNTQGQLDTLTYPTSTAGLRFKAKYGYSGGYLSSVQDYTGNVNGPVLWNLNLLDARMNAVSESYGNGLWLQNGFDALTGVPLTRQSGTGGQSSNVQNLSYAWDTAGNLTSRQDLRQSLTESFTYDALDRLTLASGPAAQSTSLGYDAIGNLTSKTGVGSYTYHATKKHAVVSAGGASYGYDANGNLNSRGGATVTWSSYNLPTSIGDPSGYSAQFYYAPDRSRWKQVSSYAGGNETTIYVGGLLEKLTTATRTHWKHLIPTPSGQVQVIRRSDGTSETLYVTTDSLGSTDAVLNAAGAVLMRGSFTVHGARRASNWQGAPSSGEWQSIADTTRRGYTGHEQLDNVMLVHMNGRVFDPAIGRFLSADPYIDCAWNPQGWNRYSYIKGRLLSATDPSGFALEEVIVSAKKWIDKGPANGAVIAFAGPAAGSAPSAGAGGPGSNGNKSQTDGKDCEATCKQIAGVSLAVAGAFAGAASGGGPIGASIGGIAGYVIGRAGSSSPSQSANDAVLALTSNFPRFPSGASIVAIPMGGIIGSEFSRQLNGYGLPSAISSPVGSATGSAVSGAIYGFFISGLRGALTVGKGAGAVGLASGALEAATSEFLQAATGCNCGT